MMNVDLISPYFANRHILNALRSESFAVWNPRIHHAVRGELLGRKLTAGLKTGRCVSLRGALRLRCTSLRVGSGDEAISFFTGKDCFAGLAMTSYVELVDTLFVVERIHHALRDELRAGLSNQISDAMRRKLQQLSLGATQRIRYAPRGESVELLTAPKLEDKLTVKIRQEMKS